MDPLKARTNYFRVCHLLIDKGGDALKGVLQDKIQTSPSPSTLDSFLKSNKKSLQKIRYSVIDAAQWKLLFPASGSADSNNFDITLLTILFRNVCGLPSPAAGWNVMPLASDTSISADIVRIKMFRNEVYGHISSAQLDDTKFETLWQGISQPLINLGVRQEGIDKLKEDPLSSEEDNYIQKLKEWKELDDDLISKLNDIGEDVSIVKNHVVDIREMLEKAKLNETEGLLPAHIPGSQSHPTTTALAHQLLPQIDPADSSTNQLRFAQLPYEIFRRICVHFDSGPPGMDWKALADWLQLTVKQVRHIENEKYKTGQIIKIWAAEDKNDVKKFIQILEDNNMTALSEEITPFLSPTSYPVNNVGPLAVILPNQDIPSLKPQHSAMVPVQPPQIVPSLLSTNEWRFDELPYGIYRKICVQFDTGAPGMDWNALADWLQLSVEQVRHIENEKYKTQQIIKIWAAEDKNDVKKFIQILKDNNMTALSAEILRCAKLNSENF